MNSNKWFPGLRRRPGARLQLFCFPFAGGGASAFRTWSDLLPPWVEVWPLEYPGHETRFRDPAIDSASVLAKEICAEIAAAVDLPFALFGHSMGALLAFETARHLRRQHAMQPAALFVAGNSAPHLPPWRPPVRQLPEALFREELRLYGGTPQEVLSNDELMQFLSPLLRRDLGICETYEYPAEPKLDFPITAFGGTEDPTVPWHRLFEWSRQSSARFRAYVMPGEHFFIRKAAPYVCKIIAQQLEQGEGFDRIAVPAAEEVHLWRVDLETPDEAVARLRPLLANDELQRAEAFRFSADRASFTVTRAALRTLLGQYGNVPPGEVQLNYSSRGKPRCPQLPVEFNVSHSGAMALIAISREQAVGVDVERIRTGLEAQEIGRQMFTPSELGELSRRPPDQQTSSLFDLWVRKEAYLKCSGEGLSGSPDRIHIGLPPLLGSATAGGETRHPTGPGRLVQSFSPDPGYAAALAVEKGWERLIFRRWRTDGFY